MKPRIIWVYADWACFMPDTQTGYGNNPTLAFNNWCWLNHIIPD